MSNAAMDALYLHGKEEADPFSFYYSNLRPLLIKYARHICKGTLRQVDDHLVTEMVDDLLIELDRFRGLSRFSTWAHARFHYRCIAEFRYRDRNLGSSLESLLEAGPSREPWEESILMELLSLTEVKDELSPEQRAVVEARLEGYTFEEIDVRLSLNRQQAYYIWKTAVEVLRS